MRTIKFRGRDAVGGKGWVYGDLVHNKKVTRTGLEPRVMVGGYEVDEESIGQYVGLKDKNGKEIYEGDIVEFYTLVTYCINPDCEPHLKVYSQKICKKSLNVKFKDGVFGVDDENCDISPLFSCYIFEEDLDHIEELEDTDVYFDTNGHTIDESIVGLKIIGNVYENPEFLNTKVFTQMMEPTELMIGDWVYRPACYDRVKEIRTEGIIGNDPLRGIVSISEVEPIPLTEEILKKNGWEYHDEDARLFPQTWVGDGLILQGTDDCGYRIVVPSDYDDQDTTGTSFVLLYVHELQHALRLIRIEKEIEL